jgi:hypothetical protein
VTRVRVLACCVAVLGLLPSAGAEDTLGTRLLQPDWEATSGKIATAGRTSLTIQVWRRGKQRAARPLRWTLACNPARGTLPHAARACRRLLALRRPFRAVPRGAACTQIFGGPQVAEVRGRLRGRRVSSQFTRTDGCQIERWNRVSFLFSG